eukprot:8328650-Karenia_brevis.AAC.1
MTGRGVRLPASLADTLTDLAVATRAEENSTMRHRSQLQEACENSFHQAANSSSSRRALLSQTWVLLKPVNG